MIKRYTLVPLNWIGKIDGTIITSALQIENICQYGKWRMLHATLLIIKKNIVKKAQDHKIVGYNCR